MLGDIPCLVVPLFTKQTPTTLSPPQGTKIPYEHRFVEALVLQYYGQINDLERKRINGGKCVGKKWQINNTSQSVFNVFLSFTACPNVEMLRQDEPIIEMVMTFADPNSEKDRSMLQRIKTVLRLLINCTSKILNEVVKVTLKSQHLPVTQH